LRAFYHTMQGVHVSVIKRIRPKPTSQRLRMPRGKGRRATGHAESRPARQCFAACQSPRVPGLACGGRTRGGALSRLSTDWGKQMGSSTPPPRAHTHHACFLPSVIAGRLRKWSIQAASKKCVSRSEGRGCGTGTRKLAFDLTPGCPAPSHVEPAMRGSGMYSGAVISISVARLPQDRQRRRGLHRVAARLKLPRAFQLHSVHPPRLRSWPARALRGAWVPRRRARLPRPHLAVVQQHRRPLLRPRRPLPRRGTARRCEAAVLHGGVRSDRGWRRHRPVGRHAHHLSRSRAGRSCCFPRASAAPPPRRAHHRRVETSGVGWVLVQRTGA